MALTIVCGLIVGPHAPNAGATDAAVPRAGFTWSVTPRFGLDADDDGLIEIENRREYTHHREAGSCADRCPPLLLDVALQASPSASDLGLPESGFLTYEWRITTDGVTGVYHRTRPDLALLLPEGDHDVDVRIGVRLPWGRVTVRSRGSMRVDDVLVVAIGDSYASGEGNPDRRIVDETPEWADATDLAVAAAHAAAHRSTVGWPARVALGIEDASPHTSVTFVDLATTGATIDHGLLGARSSPATPPQLDEVETIVEDRRIDVLLVQIGGNDVGFSRVIRALVEADPLLDPVCYDAEMDNVWRSATDGVWDRGVRITYTPPFHLGCRSTPGSRPIVPGLSGLDAALTRLADRISTMNVGSVILVEYPDPTASDAEGEPCREIVGDVTAPFGFHEVDEKEQAAGVELVLDPLNRTLAAAADRLGWTFVGGVAAAFSAGHGYCAPWPDYGYPEDFDRVPLLLKRRLDFPDGWYQPPGRYGGPLLYDEREVSWYRTAAQSAVLQGPTPRFLTAGTLHPNEVGHTAISRLVLSVLAAGD